MEKIKLAFAGGLGWNVSAVCIDKQFHKSNLFGKLAFLGCFACRFAVRPFFKAEAAKGFLKRQEKIFY